jgi:hypothetical protein
LTFSSFNTVGNKVGIIAEEFLNPIRTVSVFFNVRSFKDFAESGNVFIFGKILDGTFYDEAPESERDTFPKPSMLLPKADAVIFSRSGAVSRCSFEIIRNQQAFSPAW